MATTAPVPKLSVSIRSPYSRLSRRSSDDEAASTAPRAIAIQQRRQLRLAISACTSATAKLCASAASAPSQAPTELPRLDRK